MSTAVADAVAPVHVGRRRRTDTGDRRQVPARAAVTVVLLGAAVGLVIWNYAVRGLEARLFAPLAGLAVPTGTTGTAGSILYVALGKTSAFGLRITDECTTTVLVIPLIVVVAAFTMATSIPLRRVGLALVVALTSLLLVNAVRIAVVAFATYHFGQDGFRVAHVLIGSAFALVGFAVSLILTVRVLLRGRSGEGGASLSRHRS